MRERHVLLRGYQLGAVLQPRGPRRALLRLRRLLRARWVHPGPGLHDPDALRPPGTQRPVPYRALDGSLLPPHVCPARGQLRLVLPVRRHGSREDRSRAQEVSGLRRLRPPGLPHGRRLHPRIPLQLRRPHDVPALSAGWVHPLLPAGLPVPQRGEYLQGSEGRCRLFQVRRLRQRQQGQHSPSLLAEEDLEGGALRIRLRRGEPLQCAAALPDLELVFDLHLSHGLAGNVYF